MKWHTEAVRTIRSSNYSRTFVLAFPALPEGAVPIHVEAEFENPDSHQPSGYVLTYEVPDPDGELHCGADCPVCGGETTNEARPTQQG